MTRALPTQLLAACALALLAACSSGTPPATPATDAAPAAAAPAGANAPAAGTPAAPAAPAAAESAKADAASGDSAALENAAPLPGAGQLPALKWVAGKNYLPVSPAQPTDSPAGKVEVIEVFWYACPHCYALDPVIESWRKTKPDYVDFRRVPVTWQDVHRQHGRLFYTLQALGKEDALHKEVFELMHGGNYLYSQGNPNETFSAMQQWAKGRGIAEADFAGAWNSFGVQSSMQRASDIVTRYKVEGVPYFIINGKYATDEGMAGGAGNVISLINDLARSEHAH